MHACGQNLEIDGTREREVRQGDKSGEVFTIACAESWVGCYWWEWIPASVQVGGCRLAAGVHGGVLEARLLPSVPEAMRSVVCMQVLCFCACRFCGFSGLGQRCVGLVAGEGGLSRFSVVTGCSMNGFSAHDVADVARVASFECVSSWGSGTDCGNRAGVCQTLPIVLRPILTARLRVSFHILYLSTDVTVLSVVGFD